VALQNLVANLRGTRVHFPDEVSDIPGLKSFLNEEQLLGLEPEDSSSGESPSPDNNRRMTFDICNVLLTF
jgi:hypothetical protein